MKENDKGDGHRNVLFKTVIISLNKRAIYILIRSCITKALQSVNALVQVLPFCAAGCPAVCEFCNGIRSIRDVS